MRLVGAGSGTVSGLDFTKEEPGATSDASLGERGAAITSLLATTTLPDAFNGTPDAFLTASGTRISMYFSAGAAAPLGEVESEQERAVARTIAPAKPALTRLETFENPVERRIVTLMKRVT